MGRQIDETTATKRLADSIDIDDQNRMYVDAGFRNNAIVHKFLTDAGFRRKVFAVKVGKVTLSNAEADQLWTNVGSKLFESSEGSIRMQFIPVTFGDTAQSNRFKALTKDAS